MRPEEVLHLERGCSSQEERGDGTVRHRITGRHFKGVTEEDGNTLPQGEIRPEPWTVIELVDRAVKVEQLHDDRPLFPRSMTVRTLEPAPSEMRAEGLKPNRCIARIKSFIDWANATATRLGRAHELIPADPHGPITLRRLRRTVAWFIYRRPGGRIALGLQYGHVGSSLAESYGGRTKADMREILDCEKTLALADALAEASDRLSAGEGVGGPAAPDRRRLRRPTPAPPDTALARALPHEPGEDDAGVWGCSRAEGQQGQHLTTAQDDSRSPAGRPTAPTARAHPRRRPPRVLPKRWAGCPRWSPRRKACRAPAASRKLKRSPTR